ncbi:MAG: chemotaxis protein CheB [Pseudomonadales bacterium]|nr:chemotaxis protein CheB [Pseudomonadales bacterium]
MYAAQNSYSAIAIGVSAGGFEALAQLLPAFPKDFDLPIFITQHQLMDADRNGFIAKYYSQRCNLPVHEAYHGTQIKAGHIYHSVSGYHLQIESNGSLTLSVAPPLNHAIPSIDILFESAVEYYQSGLVGVVLTGQNTDGAVGISTIKAYGGLTIVQDPDGAEARSMPDAAIAATQIDAILPLDEIGPFLAKLSNRESP